MDLMTLQGDQATDPKLLSTVEEVFQLNRNTRERTTSERLLITFWHLRELLQERQELEYPQISIYAYEQTGVRKVGRTMLTSASGRQRIQV